MENKFVLLGVNIDHVATLRQTRLAEYPDPVIAALIAEKSGADSITLHLREDRRHIQENDVHRLKEAMITPMNLEMAMTEEMAAFAETIKPQYCCIVPEKRQELTTEGGLDVRTQLKRVSGFCRRLQQSGIRVSLFIDAEEDQIHAAAEAGSEYIEIHTGHYAHAQDAKTRKSELMKITRAASLGARLNLKVNAGHGLNYHNVQPVAAIPEIRELNIGHGIIARAMFSGMAAAVTEIKTLIREARR